MKNIAFIPARGGSKSIPLKNIHEISGKPLIYWTIKAAHESRSVEHIYVSTDSERIREVAETFGFSDVTVVDRSVESASDTASTEDAMLEFAEKYPDFENICLIQATSPLLTSEDIDGGFALYEMPDTDSVFSGNRKYQFIWTDDGIDAGTEREQPGIIGKSRTEYDRNSSAASAKDEPQKSIRKNIRQSFQGFQGSADADPAAPGFARPTYDIKNRPRRQDWSGYIVENGAFYITSRKLLLESGCRFSGRIRAYEMPANRIFEIDEPEDWEIAGELLKRREN